ncbi:hypothetical protein GCM10007164_20470 [Luteimonas padinae]|uniref:Uncharacterized protein n=1 Tax=Luteimonas padinae TaxID=1714359 RepID=A0ABV6SVQ5_9GAMM|nr:hypothetical protein [Luteimonas padinae]GHD72616.1 hypothetical protein GCM10007164_20470 [Luteimonas padinae]
MVTLEALTAQLDELENRMPQLIEDYPDDGGFWMAFAGEADVIEDQAGVHSQMVGKRLEAMLAEYGRYMSYMELGGEES